MCFKNAVLFAIAGTGGWDESREVLETTLELMQRGEERGMWLGQIGASGTVPSGIVLLGTLRRESGTGRISIGSRS